MSSTTSSRCHDNTPLYRFHCNICLDSVIEPVVTQCGHLYCWPCLYRWLEPGMLPGERLVGGSLEVDESRRVCPVCKAPCAVPTVIPIYALVEQRKNGSTNNDTTIYTPCADKESKDDFVVRQRRIPARPSRPRAIPDPMIRHDELRPSRPLARLYHLYHPPYDDSTSDPHATEYLSRILLILGSFVIVCLLLF
ncbi:E3 ubiquitin-protein ligase RNF5 [Fistulifera solaris]|jgi:E3 ubiquitin-protein ligase RNF5|uniref:RING-type E3 ubiquitin transferase n=1 Tax=Fistulifera solaris TaxID=1519565 RepID=A0A1Z5K2R8_FISSO|nr:E3 ubiquitin-protein ligase RNF5 [Fistulifera solaris]|eukprot:GAX20351.1 E3 ubiquitin-protein ligase RNF5 [Fistulifera solaris]